jgi:hypothetical protein
VDFHVAVSSAAAFPAMGTSGNQRQGIGPVIVG